MTRVYLDNNATTITDPKVTTAMEPFHSEMYGNPNSLHSFGSEIHKELSLALDRLYDGIGASDNDDIIVTGCATESNNTVIMTAYYELIQNGDKDTIITSSVEHPSILASCKFLEGQGVKVIYLPVDEDGLVSVEDLKKNITNTTALVSIMWINNETGMIFPVEEMAEIAKEHGAYFHTDGVQVVGKMPVNLKNTKIDYLSLSAHKFHGPKGVGGLFVKEGAPLLPLLHGGEQMGGKRAGTLNTAGMIGMGLAMKMATDALDYELSEVRRLKDKLEDALVKIPDTFVVGDRKDRSPNTILISVRGVEGESMLWDLNKVGIAASTGSACASEDLEANPILTEIGADSELAHTAIRLSLSRFTTEDEIDFVIEQFPKAVERLRSISSSYAKVGGIN
ncbi:MAG: NifS family cysteine desulfurase [Campylobacterales bacterium]|nr:NifS family cysteine desulfurase [Campylobacterales bacterium]